MGRSKENRERGGDVVIDGETLLRVYNAHIARLDELIAALDETDNAPGSVAHGLLETRLLRGFQARGLRKKKLYVFFPDDFTELFYAGGTFVPGLAAILGIQMREHPMLNASKQEQVQATDTHD